MAWSDAARRAALEARRRKRKPLITQVNRTQKRIEKSRYYEDRLEYAPEDLASTYDLSPAQGRLLYRRLQGSLRKGYAETSGRIRGRKASTQQLIDESRTRRHRLQRSGADRRKVAQYLRKHRRR